MLPHVRVYPALISWIDHFFLADWHQSSDQIKGCPEWPEFSDCVGSGSSLGTLAFTHLHDFRGSYLIPYMPPVIPSSPMKDREVWSDDFLAVVLGYLRSICTILRSWSHKRKIVQILIIQRSNCFVLLDSSGKVYTLLQLHRKNTLYRLVFFRCIYFIRG